MAATACIAKPGGLMSARKIDVTFYHSAICPRCHFTGFVLISFEASVGGKRYSFPNNGHLWQFNAAGKVVKYDHVTDTAQMIRMAKGE